MSSEKKKMRKKRLPPVPAPPRRTVPPRIKRKPPKVPPKVPPRTPRKNKLSDAVLKARNDSRRRGLRKEMIRNASQKSGSRWKLRGNNNRRDKKLRDELEDYLDKFLEDIQGVEKRYNKSLKMLQKMQEKMRKKFGNISDFVSDAGQDMTSIVGLSDSLSRYIESALEQSVCRPVDLAVDAFHRLAPMMKMYNIYIIQYNDFMKVFQNMKKNVSKFRKFCEKQSEAPESMMIKPVQQIPRYKLILCDLQKHLPSDDKLHQKLKETIVLVSEAADHCNDELEKHSNQLLYNDVKTRFSGKLKKFNDNPKRVVIKEGMLEKIGGFGYFQDRVFVLFCDCLAYGKGKSHGKVNIRNVLNFGTFEVFPDPAEESQFEIRIRKGSATAKDKDGLSKSKVYVIRAKSKFDVMTWIKSIHQAIEKAGVHVSQSDFYGEQFWGETMDWEQQQSDAISALCEPTVWAYASSLFAQKPFSDGEDDRYREVRKMITKEFGDDAIDTSNEMWLKMLARSRGSQSLSSPSDDPFTKRSSGVSNCSIQSKGSKAAKLLGFVDGNSAPTPPMRSSKLRSNEPSSRKKLLKVMISSMDDSDDDNDDPYEMDGPVSISSEDEDGKW